MRTALISCFSGFFLVLSYGLNASTQQGVIKELLHQAYDQCKSAHLMRRKDFAQAKASYGNFLHIREKLQEVDSEVFIREDDEVTRVLGYCETIGDDISRSEALPVFQKGVEACGRAAQAVQDNDLAGARAALVKYDEYREQAIEISAAVLEVYSVAAEVRRCERVAEEIEVMHQQAQQAGTQLQPTLDHLLGIAASCPVDDKQETAPVVVSGQVAASKMPDVAGSSVTAESELEQAEGSVTLEDAAADQVDYQALILAATENRSVYIEQIKTLSAQVAQTPGMELLTEEKFRGSAMVGKINRVKAEIDDCIAGLNGLLAREDARLEQLVAAQKQAKADAEAMRIAAEEAQKAAEEAARTAETPEEKLERLKQNAVHYTLVKRVAPEFPDRAIRRKRSGYVLLEYMITPEGEVINPVIVESNPSTLFNEAAIDAVTQWQYRPQFVDGTEPDSAIARTRMTFQLR